MSAPGTINLVPVDGPRYGGVVQFANWPWPGICMRGDTAGGHAQMLRWAADVIVQDAQPGEADETRARRVAAIAGLREFADELLKCVVDQDYIRRTKE